jgi:hypothetical protein
VRGRLWRKANPALPENQRQRLVHELMTARRAAGHARQQGDDHGEQQAHDQVDQAKRALGERGAVWWDDGSPDYNRHMARNTPYASWLAGQD